MTQFIDPMWYYKKKLAQACEAAKMRQQKYGKTRKTLRKRCQKCYMWFEILHLSKKYYSRKCECILCQIESGSMNKIQVEAYIKRAELNSIDDIYTNRLNSHKLIYNAIKREREATGTTVRNERICTRKLTPAPVAQTK